ncbi:MAG: hypothetical protein AAB346_06345, partial [Pseudomonadota bacterium]
MVSQQLGHAGAGLETARQHAPRDPAGQLRGLDRPGDHHRAGGIERLGPAALARGLFELAGNHQQQRVRRRRGGVLHQLLRAGL